MFGNPEWIEATFHRRECRKAIPSLKDSTKCCCGLSISSHALPLLAPPVVLNHHHLKADSGSTENWNPSRHTVPLATNAFGCIDFQGGPHPNKAQYIRLGHDAKPDSVFNLLLKEWGLELPKLLISISGGKQNFHLQPRLKKALGEGLLKAAKTTGAWILTGGLNTGVTRHVGDALVTERSPRLRSGRVVSIGIAPWGVVENRKDLIHKNKDIPYHSIHNPATKFSVLNNQHAYFLLVDNGTVGKYGAELALRRKLEKFVSLQKLNASRSRKFPYWTHCSTPLVCLVIEGGTNTIRSVLEYVTSNPPVPVVIFDGSGRAADILAFAYRYMGGEYVVPDMQEEFTLMIQKTFSVDLEHAEQLYREVLMCVKVKALITVYRCSEEHIASGDKRVELDQTILTALFKSEHLSSAEQLSLALTWNRDDIARSEVFQYGVEWSPGVLEQAMMDALINDRVAFVKLLLENGVNIQKFLTIERLEELYNCKQGPANTLRYLVKDVVPKMPRGYIATLIDIGNVINQLMGGGYKSSYTRRRFRHFYVETTSPVKIKKSFNKTSSFHRDLWTSSFRVTNGTAHVMENMDNSNQGRDSGVPGESYQYFDRPFSELMIWAVLTKRQEMALLMWQHGEESIAKALVACTLYNAMAYEAEDDDLDVEIYEELIKYAEEFQKHALNVIDYCYQQDDDLTQQLLTASLENWSRQTCLSLAVLANNRKFLAHPLCQIILGDLWMGGLRMRKNPGFKIILGLLFPPTIIMLEFKTKEELELMPQLEEEYIQDKEDGEESSSSSSISDVSGVGDGDDVESLGGGRQVRWRQQDDGDSDEAVQIVGEKENHLPLLDEPDNRRPRPLKLKKKFYEFYAAPITKFYCHFLGYLIFLGLYTYMCLVRTPDRPSTPEIIVTAYISSYGLEKIRQLISQEPSTLSQKWKVWVEDSKWHPLDLGAILIYLLGFTLRWDPETRPYGRVIYCTDINYFFIRILKFLSVSKYFGPVVTMMYSMVKNMLYFIMLLLVVLVSFGVCQQSIKYPNEDWNWRLLRHVFYQPYFMLYGEVYAPDIDPECNPDCSAYGECGTALDGSLLVPCHPGRWVTPIAMTLYLLCANILIINILIAVFNNIYQQVNAISQEVWNFQRYSVVMEYEEKPILPPPFIILSHIHRLIRSVYRRYTGEHVNLESGLKLFLENYDLEKLYDFEEECVEGYMRGLENSKRDNTEVRVRNMVNTTDNFVHKIEILGTNLNGMRADLQANQICMRKLEELCEQTANNMAVIHRFMATRMDATDDTGSRETGLEDLLLPLPPAASGRKGRKISCSRTVSERSSQDPGYDLDDLGVRPRSRRIKSPSHYDPVLPLGSPKKASTKFRKLRHSSSEKERKISSENRRQRTISSDVASNISEEPEDNSEILKAIQAESIEKEKEKAELAVEAAEVAEVSARAAVPEVTARAVRIEAEVPDSAARGGESDGAESVPDGGSSNSSSTDDELKELYRHYTRHKLASSRQYTSITDELEGRLPVFESKSEATLPAIRVEASDLMDAEEADYNLFENLIERRLRRESNFNSSMEDMINRSIREDSSSTPSSSSDEDTKGSRSRLDYHQAIMRAQSRIRTRRSAKVQRKRSKQVQQEAVLQSQASKNTNKSADDDVDPRSPSLEYTEVPQNNRSTLARNLDNPAPVSGFDNPLAAVVLHDTVGGASQHDTGGGASQHDKGGGAPQHDTGGGAPQHDRRPGVARMEDFHHERRLSRQRTHCRSQEMEMVVNTNKGKEDSVCGKGDDLDRREDLRGKEDDFGVANRRSTTTGSNVDVTGLRQRGQELKLDLDKLRHTSC